VGTLTVTEVGSSTVVGEGVMAKDVWQCTIGSVANVEPCEPAVFRVDVDVDIDVDIDVDVG
jgi:hypothetical protein